LVRLEPVRFLPSVLPFLRLETDDSLLSARIVGKTESVKALGVQLGRFVLVFCCDETFDFQAMGRIFVGLCQVGAWGCFDEFNRLEERMMSAVSQQVQGIQQGLALAVKDPNTEIELVGKQLKISVHTGSSIPPPFPCFFAFVEGLLTGIAGSLGIFITMNPGYAGRSNLPDNLKSQPLLLLLLHMDDS
jgi:dynein heavy chain 1